MPEATQPNWNVPVTKGHDGHRVRALILNREKGMKCLYCQQCKKFVAYILKPGRGWTAETAVAEALDHYKQFVSFDHVSLDQMPEFLKVIAVKSDGESEEFLPNSPSFIFDEAVMRNGAGAEPATDIAKKEAAMEIKETVPADEAQEGMTIVKIDKDQRMVYGVFLWPNEADHDGDVISKEDIEKVAHGFMADYRTIDEMHKNVIEADIVESAIAWQDDLDFFGKKLSKGAWFGAVKVYDDAVWEKIKSGVYKGFSVRISGTRETIE